MKSGTKVAFADLLRARHALTLALHALGHHEERREPETGLTEHERLVVNRAIAVVRAEAPGPKWTSGREGVARQMLRLAVRALGNERRDQKKAKAASSGDEQEEADPD